jgi:pimeloyl-ACP methyl ester carboxylesterase
MQPQTTGAVLGRSPKEIEHLRMQPDWSNRVAAVNTVPREVRAGALEFRFDWSRLVSLARPTLLLMGELSPPRLRASVAALHAVLPDSKVITLRGHGHDGLVTAPDLVAAEVVQFVKQLGQ